jgi:vacuolar protein 8
VDGDGELDRDAELATNKAFAPDVRAVDRDTLGPILFLLENSDIEVQRAASAALGNLAVNSKQELG